MGFYTGVHWCQFDESDFTASYGCTWTAVANGIGNTTGGSKKPSPDYIHSLLPRSSETNPNTPGWSIPDAVHAASRYGMSMTDRSNDGWSALIDDLDNGHYCVVQGRSSAFSDGTCSGKFNGPHAIGVSPKTRVYNGHRQHWIDDGICQSGRWEYDYIIRRFAEAIAPKIWFARFNSRVPSSTPTVPTSPTGGDVAIRYVPALTPTKRMSLAKGTKLFDRPGGKAVTTMSNAGTPPLLGLSKSPTGKSWRCVAVKTGWSYDEGVHLTGLYVPATAGKVVKA